MPEPQHVLITIFVNMFPGAPRHLYKTILAFKYSIKNIGKHSILCNDSTERTTQLEIPVFYYLALGYKI